MRRRPPRSTRTDTLFPYTTLFRSINYREEDFVEVIKQATGGKGVDVVLDMVGGDYIPRNIKAMAEDGRLSFIAFLGGAKAEVNFAAVMMKRLTITGSTLRARPVAVKAADRKSTRLNSSH